MPRNSKLVQLQPNKFYSVEGTVRYKHESEGFTTLIIQQGLTQKKVKIPENNLSIIQGRGYKFGNCFYNSQGWLSAKKPNQSIIPLQVQQQSTQFSLISLKHLKQNFQDLQDKYFSTYLKIVSIQPDQVIIKNDKEIHLKILRGYSDGYLVDITIWNTEILNQQFIDQWMLFEGLRVKKMTQDKFILVSTVFTAISILQRKPEDQYFSEKIKNYQNLSEIYQRRNLDELVNMGIPEKKIFSIVKAKVKSIVKAEYQGCPKCKRKIQQKCNICNINNQMKYSYGKVTLQDQLATIQVIIFDQKICELFKFAKQNCVIEAKVKTFSRIDDGQTVISHILTKIDSIFF